MGWELHGKPFLRVENLDPVLGDFELRWQPISLRLFVGKYDGEYE